MATVPTISLCMIVRDEEHSLGRCLASAASAVDEICLVDTGSTDRSVEIAREYGARVESIPWNDSFAEARNHSLEMARGEWILVLDADETLAAGAGETLRRIAAGAFDTPPTATHAAVRVLGAMAQLVDHLDGGTRQGWVLRFFRNAPEHRYVGAIHNRLGPAFDARAEAADSKLILCDELSIDHFGYTREIWDQKRKTERALRLYERALRDDPDDLYTRYKHADFLRGQGDPERARGALDSLCDRLATLPASERARYAWHSESFALCALAWMEAGDLATAGARIEQGTACPKTANFAYVRGLWLLQSDRSGEAFRCFNECRAIEGPARIQAPAPGVATWKSALGMVRALRGMGQAEAAALLLRDAAGAYPESSELREELARSGERAAPESAGGAANR